MSRLADGALAPPSPPWLRTVGLILKVGLILRVPRQPAFWPAAAPLSERIVSGPAQWSVRREPRSGASPGAGLAPAPVPLAGASPRGARTDFRMNDIELVYRKCQCLVGSFGYVFPWDDGAR